MAKMTKNFPAVRCNPVWAEKGTTNCWSGDPATAPPRPGYCPTGHGAEIIEKSFAEYTGDSEDARLALVAAKVEGLCYLKTPGSTTVTARWTRVEDTIALARLMGWKKIGIATCIGLLGRDRESGGNPDRAGAGAADRLLQGGEHRQEQPRHCRRGQGAAEHL